MSPAVRRLELTVLKGLRTVGTALLEEKKTSSESLIKVIDGGEIMTNGAEYSMGIGMVMRNVYTSSSQNPELNASNKNRITVAVIPPITESNGKSKEHWRYYNGENEWESPYSPRFNVKLNHRKNMRAYSQQNGV